MTEKQSDLRYTMKYSNHYALELEFYDNNEKISPKELITKINKLQEENQELKDEILLLKEGLEAYDNKIPLVCTCSQVRDINSEMSDFKIKQNKFYKEHRVVVKKGD